MRGIVYAVAVLAAGGIMYLVATTPINDAGSSASEDAVAKSVTAEAAQIMTEPGTLTLSIPSMHCAIACYPRVEETLESMAGVSEVELDKQKEEGIIDNRQVVVHYDAGFDLSAALAGLKKEGFADSGLVQ